MHPLWRAGPIQSKQRAVGPGRFQRHRPCPLLPCATIGEHLLARHLLPPFGQGLFAWLLSALPILVLRGSRQVQGIRACLWPLMQLWLHLVLAYLAFPHNPVWAYAWALHAPASVLISWAPPRRSLALQSLQPWLSLLGVLCISFYAWSTGAPPGSSAGAQGLTASAAGPTISWPSRAWTSSQV